MTLPRRGECCRSAMTSRPLIEVRPSPRCQSSRLPIIDLTAYDELLDQVEAVSS